MGPRAYCRQKEGASANKTLLWQPKLLQGATCEEPNASQARYGFSEGFFTRAAAEVRDSSVRHGRPTKNGKECATLRRTFALNATSSILPEQ